MTQTDGAPGIGVDGGSAARVRTFLEARGLADSIVHFEQSTRTAQMAADAMGCELGQIAKSLVFVAGQRPVVALVAGDRRGDPTVIAREAGADDASFADAAAVRAATGYAIGAVSPFDLPPEVLVLVDESLARFEIVYPAAGTPSSMVRMTFTELLETTRGRVAAVGKQQ